MNVDFFLKFAKFRIGNLVSAEDFADKFNYQLTCFIMILFVALVGVRQYVFTPIQCWIPHEWARSWEEYAENYCWVQDTYFADTQDGPPKAVDERARLKINYYQWVPFVLGLQCLLFYLPHIIWKVAATKVGTNVNHLVRYATAAAEIDQDKRHKMVNFVAKEVVNMMDSKRDDYRRSGTWFRIRNRFGRIFPFYMFGKRSGFLLLIIYILVKLLYVTNSIGQLFLMQKFIGADSPFFGWNILYNINHGRSWEHTGIFPRVTWCDLRRKVIANSQLNSFMCVLPVNMLNEKIYIFLWFLIVIGLILTGVSIITWIVRVSGLKNRKIFIKKYLRILEVISDDEEEKQQTKAFVRQFLRHDGIFVLMMISRNAGELVAADIVKAVYEKWLQKREEQKKKMNDAEMNPTHTLSVVSSKGSKSRTSQYV